MELKKSPVDPDEPTIKEIDATIRWIWRQPAKSQALDIYLGAVGMFDGQAILVAPTDENAGTVVWNAKKRRS